MKKNILFLAFLFVACEDKDPKIGCQYGTNKVTRQKELIRCATYNQHTAGGNVSAGGTAAYNSYSNVQWKEVKYCDECQKLDYSQLP